MKVLTTNEELLLGWAKLAHGFRTDRLVNPIPVGLIDTKTKKVCVCVIYEDFNGRNVEGHILSDGSKQWLTKDFLKFMFDYPYNVLHVERITAQADADNSEALHILERLGFKEEARLEGAGGRGQDVVITRQFKDECRFL